MSRALFAVCLLWVAMTLHAQKSMNLEGSWAFGIDRQDKGEKERWFDKHLDDRMNLPGSMPEKWKGDEVTARTQWTGSLYDSSY